MSNANANAPAEADLELEHAASECVTGIFRGFKIVAMAMAEYWNAVLLSHSHSVILKIQDEMAYSVKY